MAPSRRAFVKGTAAAAALMSAPSLLRAQPAPTSARTLRAVLHGDLQVFDPIWTTANMTGNHALLIYDTLFGMDENRKPQPQMVEKWDVSDDRKTYTFTLRAGQKFHDGQDVTSADVVASIRRWAVRDGTGQHMFKRVSDTRIRDEKTFQIVLREPYGLVLDALGKIETNVPVIMRKKDAETDPNQQVLTKVGSGAFAFNERETRSGQRYVYDRNPNYVPRGEPPSGMAGGKVAKVDRVIIENMADQQTAVAALKAGEIDFYETPPIDLLDQLESDNNVKLEVLSKGGNVGMCRLNWLHPPFDKVEARQAMLHLIKQEDILKAVFGNPKYYQACGSLFGCTGQMRSDVNTGWFTGGQDIAKARELFRKAGYDGRPVVILQATNVAFMNNASLLVFQWLKAVGVNAELAASDWGAVISRRAVKKPSRRADGTSSSHGARAKASTTRSASRPIRRAAKPAGSAGPRTTCTRSCATNGRSRPRSTRARRLRPSCRRTPGPMCRWRCSDSGRRRSRGAPTSGASCRFRPTCRSGTSRRFDRTRPRKK
jgi:peptide/nickel transport system substrate-binding protein